MTAGDDLERRLRRTVLAVAGLNFAYFFVQFTVALHAGSVSLLADSVDYLEDTVVNVFVALGFPLACRAVMGRAVAVIILGPAAYARRSNFEPMVDSTSRSSRSEPSGESHAADAPTTKPTFSRSPRFGKSAVAQQARATSHLATITSPTASSTTLTYNLTAVRPPSRSKRKVPPAVRRQIAADRLAGASIRDLTQRYDLARSSVQNILSKEGVPSRRNIIGEQHRTELERLRRQGLSAAQIASRFGVSPSTALRAMRRLGVEVHRDEHHDKIARLHATSLSVTGVGQPLEFTSERSGYPSTAGRQTPGQRLRATAADTPHPRQQQSQLYDCCETVGHAGRQQDQPIR